MKRYVITDRQHYGHFLPVGTVVELQRESNPTHLDVLSIHPVPCPYGKESRKMEQTVHPDDCRPWPQVGDEVIIPKGTTLCDGGGAPLLRGALTSVEDYRGRVTRIETEEGDPIPFEVNVLNNPAEPNCFWGYRGLRWFGEDQLQPPPAPSVAPGHNPAGLTVEQVGEGWRLLAPEETREKPGLSHADHHSIQCWKAVGQWDNSGWDGNSEELTYRTQRPEGYFLPKPEVKQESAPTIKVGDVLFVPKGHSVPGVGKTKSDTVVKVAEIDPGAPLDVMVLFQRRDFASSEECLGEEPVEWWIPSKGTKPCAEGALTEEAEPAEKVEPASEAKPFKVGDAVVVPAGHDIPRVGKTKRKSIGAVIDTDASPGRIRVRMDRLAAGLPHAGESLLQYPSYYVPFKGLEPEPLQ